VARAGLAADRLAQPPLMARGAANLARTSAPSADLDKSAAQG
jgi:hypothetical protein